MLSKTRSWRSGVGREAAFASSRVIWRWLRSQRIDAALQAESHLSTLTPKADEKELRIDLRPRRKTPL